MKSFSSMDSLMRLCRCTSVLFLVLLSCDAVWPQAALPGAAPATAQPEVPKDTLGRTSPRSMVLGFLAVARKKDYQVAAEYLNTRLRGKAAADLAQQLSVVLDRRLPARLNELSDKPEGSLLDPLHPDRDLVGTIASESGNVNIVLERVDRGKNGPVWLFSSQTLESIPDVYQEINTPTVDAVLPDFLVTTRVAGVQLFELLIVFVGLPLVYFLAVFVNRLLSPWAGRLRRRLAKKTDLPDPELLPRPVRLLLLAFCIRLMLSRIGPSSLLARQFWASVSAVLAVFAIAWILILLNGRIERYAQRRLRRRDLAGATSVLRLARRFFDLMIGFAGVLVILRYFGVNPTAALAGLGVGGIAVALAAQKTLENVIGGASMIVDQVVRVGDTLKVGDTLGTVDEIGLRSTRIRTMDRTVVSVPNGQIANMSLETLSARDKFWFHPLLGLRYETTASQMRSVTNRIRALLLEHPSIEHGSVRVRFVSFGSSSLDVDIFAYVYAQDWNAFLEVQEGLLLTIMEVAHEAGVQIAFPSRTLYVKADSANEIAQVSRPAQAPPADGASGDKTTAKSA